MVAQKTGNVRIGPPEKSDISSFGIDSLVLINNPAPGQDIVNKISDKPDSSLFGGPLAPDVSVNNNFNEKHNSVINRNIYFSINSIFYQQFIIFRVTL